jgi:hypothetical protein
MNSKQDRINDQLFAPLNTSNIPVTLDELQQYVASAPASKSSTPYYAVAAILILTFGSVLFFMRESNPIENNIAEPIPVKEAAPHAPITESIASTDSQVLPVHRSHAKLKQKKLDRTLGIAEKPLVLDPSISMSSQYCLSYKETSFLVTFESGITGVIDQGIQ